MRFDNIYVFGSRIVTALFIWEIFFHITRVGGIYLIPRLHDSARTLVRTTEGEGFGPARGRATVDTWGYSCTLKNFAQKIGIYPS